MQKPKFLLLAVLSLLSVSEASAQKQNDLQKKLEKKKEAFKLLIFINNNHTWAQQGFKGKVKTVETYKYCATDPTGAVDKVLEFDKNFKDSFSADGYSINGIWTSGISRQTGHWFCSYDAQHHDTMTVSMRDDGTIHYADKKKYDAKGRQVNWSPYNKFSKDYAVSDEYKYDDNDNIIHWLHRQSQEPNDYSEDSLTYYDFGLVKTITSIDHRSNTRSIRINTYDTNYDLIRDSYEINEEYYTNTYEYDLNDNRLAQYALRRNGDTDRWNKYMYNSDGDLLQDDSYTYIQGEHQPIHEIYTIEYEYDSNKNITKRTKFRLKNDKKIPIEMALNRYTYY